MATVKIRLNLFFLDDDPYNAAAYLGDLHVARMPIITGQLLSQAIRRANPSEYENRGLYGLGRTRGFETIHPLIVWLSSSTHNYSWGCRYFECICLEYQRRFNREHVTYSKLRHKLELPAVGTRIYIHDFPTVPKPILDQDAFQAYMARTENAGIDATWIDLVTAYREYYIRTRSHLCKWTNREIPSWYKQTFLSHGTNEVSSVKTIKGFKLTTSFMAYPSTPNLPASI